MAFGMGFVTLYMLFTQLNQKSAGTSSVTIFKRGTKIGDASSSLSDEEKASPSPIAPARHISTEKSDPDDASAKIASEDRTYTWQNVTYTIELENGEKRRLLDDVSGYVGPGLTALMGESGKLLLFVHYGHLLISLQEPVKQRCSMSWLSDIVLERSRVRVLSTDMRYPEIFISKRKTMSFSNLKLSN